MAVAATASNIGSRDVLRVKIASTPLDVIEAQNFVSSAKCGAISIFIGTTRDTEAVDDNVVGIESLYYEAYADMAVKMMRCIAEDSIRNDGVERCYIAHRIGLVHAAESSIIVACSSKHRHEAHAAVMNVVNAVKSRVPVWKRPCTQSATDESGPVPGNWSDKSEAFWLASKDAQQS